MTMFQGFSPATIDFLWAIRFNNERTWFEAHKQDYLDHLYTPMKELCQELYQACAQRHEDLSLVSRVCRIYRDARRLHGRGPYKDHLWLTVSAPAEEWSARPTFWFEIAPEDYNYGLGYWMARSSTMAALRARLDADPRPFEALTAPLEADHELELSGEGFKRRRPAPSPAVEPYYNMKSGFSFACRKDVGPVLFSRDLVEVVLDKWEELMPLYRWLDTLDGDME